MKILLALAVFLAVAMKSPVSADPFFAEQADVLQEDEFLLKEGFFFLKFVDILQPLLYEENPPYFIQGTLSRKKILEFPVELRAGLTDNLTIGFSTSYIWNLQDLNINGNPNIVDGSYTLSSCGFAHLGFVGKYGIIKEEDDIPGFSILVRARFPLGDEDLFGEDKNFKLKLPLGLRGITLGIYELVSKKLNFWTVHFNFGYEYRAPYSQNSNSLGKDLVQVRTIDPGDRMLYNFACIRDWEKFSLVIELNGVITRDLRINDISIKDSGMHTLDGILGVQYHPVHNFFINIGVRGTILSSVGDRENNLGLIINSGQRF